MSDEQAKRRLVKHFGLNESLVQSLVDAGFTTPRLIKAAGDKTLKAVKDIGDAALIKIRASIG